MLAIFHIIVKGLPGLGVYKHHTVITLSSQIPLHSHNMADYSLVYQLLLLGLIAVVHCQSYPRFEFNGNVLVNNSYIYRGGIGEGVNNSLHCVTDHSNCCNNSGLSDWYDETEMPVHQGEDGNSSLYVTRGKRVVYLNRRTGGSRGMWRCDIPDGSGTDQSIYIYLGTKQKGII